MFLEKQKNKIVLSDFFDHFLTCFLSYRQWFTQSHTSAVLLASTSSFHHDWVAVDFLYLVSPQHHCLEQAASFHGMKRLSLCVTYSMLAICAQTSVKLTHVVTLE